MINEIIKQLSVTANYGITKSNFGFVIRDLLYCFEVFNSLNREQRYILLMALFQVISWNEFNPSIDPPTLLRLEEYKTLCSNMRYLTANLSRLKTTSVGVNLDAVAG
jgi:hypothetical protein